MTEDQARKLAKKHIQNMNEDNSHSEILKWIETEPVKSTKGYYFEYEFELRNPDNPIAFGGSPGFLIYDETGELNDLNWKEYNDLWNDR